MEARPQEPPLWLTEQEAADKQIEKRRVMQNLDVGFLTKNFIKSLTLIKLRWVVALDSPGSATNIYSSQFIYWSLLFFLSKMAFIKVID